MPQSDCALEFSIVVVRRVRAGGSHKCRGDIHHRVLRSRTSVNGSSIDVWLERRSDLAERLSRAVKFRLIEVPASNHGLNFSAHTVNREQCALNSGILLKANSRFAVWTGSYDSHIREVSRGK